MTTDTAPGTPLRTILPFRKALAAAIVDLMGYEPGPDAGFEDADEILLRPDVQAALAASPATGEGLRWSGPPYDPEAWYEAFEKVNAYEAKTVEGRADLYRQFHDAYLVAWGRRVLATTPDTEEPYQGPPHPHSLHQMMVDAASTDDRS